MADVIKIYQKLKQDLTQLVAWVRANYLGKVQNPTAGHFAGVDSNGNVVDSGYGSSSFQTPLAAQTAYNRKGSASAVPQITTNALGQVTAITEVPIDIPASQVQTDWQENDTTSVRHIQNRTHYVESVSYSDKWNQSNVEVGSGSSSPGAYSGTFTVTAGNKYRVIITNGNDSKTYTDIEAEYNSSLNGMLLNKNWSNPMSSPSAQSDAFYILVQSSNIVLASVDVYGSNCTVQVSEITENVKKLDRKYLPALNEIDHISSSKSGSVTTVTITETEGATTSFQISDGEDGTDGTDGTDGKSAYQVAVDNGYSGTEAQWLASLKGADGVSLGEIALTQEVTQDTDKVPSDKAVYDELANIKNKMGGYICTSTNLADALLEVPLDSRVPEFILSYPDAEDPFRYHTYQYKGKYYTELDWTTETSWLDLDNPEKYRVYYWLECPDLSTYTTGTFNTNGTINTSGNGKITDFIEIPENSVSIGGGWFNRYVIYDSDKTTILSTAVLYGGKLFRPTAGSYVRVQFTDYNVNWNYGYKQGSSGTPAVQRPHVRVFPNWNYAWDYTGVVDWTQTGGTSDFIRVYQGQTIGKFLITADTDNLAEETVARYFKLQRYDLNKNAVGSVTNTPNTYTMPTDGYIKLLEVRNLVWQRGSSTYEPRFAICYSNEERAYNDSKMKNWLLLGDSISAHTSTYASQGYGWLIASGHRFNVNNRAESGYTSGNILSSIQNIDLEPYDVCTIAVGTNDCNYNRAVGDYKSDMSAIIDYIQTNKPSIKIGIFNLFRRAQYPTDATASEAGNVTWGQYETAVKEIANQYGIPLLDVEHECQANFRITTYADNYSVNSDGLHPNNECHKLFILPLVKQFLRKLLGIEELDS